MSSEVHGGLHSWSLPIPVTLFLIAVALVYMWGWHRLRKVLPTLLSGWRFAAFMSGVISVWAAAASPLANLDHQLLTIHMVQHLLLMMVAAPLILQGASASALLHGVLWRFVRGALGRFLRCPQARRLERIVTHPVFCWVVSTAVVIGWHIPAPFELGMRSAGWHGAEHASFLVAGILFWWPVIRPWPSLHNWPSWHIPLYLFLATLPCDVLSAFLAFCNHVVYPHYLSAQRLFDFSPLVDQQCAGALMWVSVTFAYLIPAAAVTIRLLSPRKPALRVEAV
jgi:cytochrome c oxidase assembly factor CtaG